MYAELQNNLSLYMVSKPFMTNSMAISTSETDSTQTSNPPPIFTTVASPAASIPSQNVHHHISENVTYLEYVIMVL
jgi:hypothetical protein